MRTTLDIDEDILEVMREVATARNQSLGKVISDEVRQKLKGTAGKVGPNGFGIIDRGPGAPMLTLEMVNQIRDEV